MAIIEEAKALVGLVSDRPVALLAVILGALLAYCIWEHQQERRQEREITRSLINQTLQGLHENP